MKRFVKRIRGQHEIRGYYSYLQEALIEILWAHMLFPDEEIKVYFDLVNVHHYLQNNLFDVCFVQDKNDYETNISEYVNIETLGNKLNFDHYNLLSIPDNIRNSCPELVKKYYILNNDIKHKINERLSQFDVTKTIGVHRRDTDMKRIHHINSPNLFRYFEEIEKNQYENVFLMSDNKIDLDLFRERYGNKLICFEDGVTSNNSENPFFLSREKTHESMKKHIEEITINTFILSMTKKLICTSSNLSMFAILSNSNLEYQKIK